MIGSLTRAVIVRMRAVYILIPCMFVKVTIECFRSQSKPKSKPSSLKFDRDSHL